METSKPTIESIMAAPNFDPEQKGARFWYEQYPATSTERPVTKAVQSIASNCKQKLNSLKKRRGSGVSKIAAIVRNRRRQMDTSAKVKRSC